MNKVGVEEKMKNIPLPSDVLSTDSEDKSKVVVPKADYMLGIAGRYLVKIVTNRYFFYY